MSPLSEVLYLRQLGDTLVLYFSSVDVGRLGWNISLTHSNITVLLEAVGQKDPAAMSQLWSVIYLELKSLASQQMAAERKGHTLQPTALVHEAFFRLFDKENCTFENGRHLFAAAARAMRQIRIDSAKARKRLKRGGGVGVMSLDQDVPVFDDDPTELLDIDTALTKLEEEDARKAEIVMLRYFAGLTEEETASAMGLSRRTIQLEWRIARAWLHRELAAD